MGNGSGVAQLGYLVKCNYDNIPVHATLIVWPILGQCCGNSILFWKEIQVSVFYSHLMLRHFQCRASVINQRVALKRLWNRGPTGVFTDRAIENRNRNRRNYVNKADLAICQKSRHKTGFDCVFFNWNITRAFTLELSSTRRKKLKQQKGTGIRKTINMPQHVG